MLFSEATALARGPPSKIQLPEAADKLRSTQTAGRADLDTVSVSTYAPSTNTFSVASADTRGELMGGPAKEANEWMNE